MIKRAIAVDGKTLRGSRTAQCTATVLLAAMAHAGEVLAQQQIADKSYEIPAFEPLLAPLDLTGALITADALHTQHDHGGYAWREPEQAQPVVEGAAGFYFGVGGRVEGQGQLATVTGAWRFPLPGTPRDEGNHHDAVGA
ncbi:hypothetical protein [Streptomyces atratus]|uniref:Uncharacterized protein n=1 Tax=Streptomyces atratus TaxID=1893 RepID=A0A1K2E9P8_STRAR|nr:hypothetical protein SAMN02787144_101811 [Streptomyces atratus]